MTAQSGLGFSGIVAIQIPDDGAPGFVLTKLTADNYDYDWLAGGGGASTIIVEDEGVPVGVPADTLDFVGAGVIASGAGTTKTITIPGGGGPASTDWLEFVSQAVNPGVVAANTLYQDDGSNFDVDSVVMGDLTVPMVLTDNVSIGDPGTEQGGINVGGINFNATSKINDFGGTVDAMLVLHRHSTAFGSNLVFSRSNSDTAAHAALTPGQTISQVVHTGWSGTHYDIAAFCNVNVPAGSTVSPTSLAGEYEFFTTPDGSNISLLALQIGSDQSINMPGAQLQFGDPAQRLFDATNRAGATPGYGGFEFYPDDFTRLDIAIQPGSFSWSSTLTSSAPGGGAIGNDTAPNFVSWQGEIILTEQGNLFNTQSLFNQGTVVTCDGANTGPIYTMINQPQFRVSAAGGARTGSQQNAVRSQIRVGPNIAGTFALATHETYFAVCIMNATGGAVSIGTVNYFAPKAPSGMGGGATIGTLNCIDLPNIPSTGITTLRGINSAMSSGQFINHTGVASAEFTNSAFRMRFDDNAGIEMGTGNDVLIRWDGATFNFEFATGGDLEFTGPSAGEIILRTPTAVDGLQLDFAHLSIGDTATLPAANWFTIFSGPNLRSPSVGGEYSDVLWTAGGTIDINGLAMSDVQAFKINSISTILNGGSVADSSTLFVSAMQSANATRVQALRVTGRARIDGVMNNGSLVLAQIVANQNDYQLGQNNNQRTMNLINSDAARNITGIDSSFGFAQDGDRICLYNTGAFNISLTHQDVLSLAANRFITSTGVTYIIGPDECVWLWYDDTGTARWRMLEGTGA